MSNHHITLDIDWCSDDTLSYVSDLCLQHHKRVTWFATHLSDAVSDLFSVEHYEIGLHPNFLAGSTHGATEREVLEHITSLFPHATAMRTHGLYQSSPLLDLAVSDFGVEIDVSLLLPHHSELKIIKGQSLGGKSLTRIPYFWGDDTEMINRYTDFSFSDPLHHCSGLKIYDFHPVHIALNTSSFEDYKQVQAKKPLPEWDKKFILTNQKKGRGALSFFEEFLAGITGEKTIREIVDEA